MKIFVTNLPSFYKINLYNKICKQTGIFVIYTGQDSNGRNADFFSGKMNFPHFFLKGNSLVKSFQLFRFLKQNPYQEIIVGGWDSVIMWITVFLFPKSYNSIVVESTIKESGVSGLKAIFKRIFLQRISKAYVSGKSHEQLVRTLGFDGVSVITKGVGLFNIIPQPSYQPRSEVKHFLFVGRLVAVKNLTFLIEKFNSYPELSLTIVGFGVLDEELKSIANSNIHFVGAIDNKLLPKYYQEAEVFVLPSYSETWGVVVEEALNNGTPVLLSNQVGCIDEVINEGNGVIFSLQPDNFEEKLCMIRNVDFYNNLRKNISKIDYKSIEQYQVSCYCE